MTANRWNRQKAVNSITITLEITEKGAAAIAITMKVPLVHATCITARDSQRDMTRTRRAALDLCPQQSSFTGAR